MNLENETRAEFAARMDKEGNSRADMIAAYYGLFQWYRGTEAEVARLRAERDAARAEVERLRADLLEALPSVYAEMGLTDYVKDLHRELAQLTQTLNAARAAARAWKRKAYQWRNEAANALGLWPNVGWRVSELRRWYREYIR